MMWPTQQLSCVVCHWRIPSSRFEARRDKAAAWHRFEWRTSEGGREVQQLICSADLEKGERERGALHREERVVGRGWRQRLGRDEREEMLVAAAGKKVRDVERRESERI
jgi:hypothetical protein